MSMTKSTPFTQLPSVANPTKNGIFTAYDLALLIHNFQKISKNAGYVQMTEMPTCVT